MRKMGIAALGPKLRTTKPAPGHKIFPYLLRKKTIDRANQVWAADITYSAPRPGWSGVHMSGMRKRKEETNKCLALCCGRA